MVSYLNLIQKKVGYHDSSRKSPHFRGEKLVVSIKKYFNRCQHKTDIKEPGVQKTADAICVGVATVKRIMADYDRDPKLLEQQPNIRGRRPYAIDVSYQENVRSCIREADSHGNYFYFVNFTFVDAFGYLYSVVGA